MSQSLLEQLGSLVTPDVLQSLSKLTGEPQAAISKGLGAAFPTLLNGLLQGSGNAGLMQQVASAITGGGAPTWLGSLGSLLAAGKLPGSAWAMGSQLLSTLYSNKLDGVTGAIASFAGLRPTGATSVLGLAAPMVLGLLGNRMGQSGGVSAAGLASLLGAEKAGITAAMPQGLTSLISQLSTPVKAAAAAGVATAASAAVSAATAAVKPAVAPAAAAPAPAPAAARPAAPAPAAAAHHAPAAAAHHAPAAAAKPVAAAVQHTTAAAAKPAAAAAKPAAATAATVARPAEHVAAERGGSNLGFLALWWPLLAAFAALIWWWASGLTTSKPVATAPAVKVEAAKPATPPAAAPAVKVEAPKVEAPKVVEAPKPAPAPAAAPTPAPAPAAAPVASTPGKRALSTGALLEFDPMGIESKVIGFIEDGTRPVDKLTWFDFDRLNFKTGSADLTAESMAQVKNMYEILRAYPAVQLKIGGYTDNVGDPEKNMKLSQVRAQSVVTELVNLGVGGGRLEAEGYGEQHPIASNDTAEGRAKNRRISVRVTAK